MAPGLSCMTLMKCCSEQRGQSLSNGDSPYCSLMVIGQVAEDCKGPVKLFYKDEPDHLV